MTSAVAKADPERDLEADAREAALDRREQALTDRLDMAEEIDAAATERDAISDARDLRADNREEALNRARSAKEGFSYDADAPGRHAAARDRLHAKGDRQAAGEDRVAIIKDPADRQDPEAT